MHPSLDTSSKGQYLPSPVHRGQGVVGRARASSLWCESMGTPACMSMNKSPHSIVGVSDGVKMESLRGEGVSVVDVWP